MLWLKACISINKLHPRQKNALFIHVQNERKSLSKSLLLGHLCESRIDLDFKARVMGGCVVV